MSYKGDKYPEHAKLSAISDESQAIGAFLDHGLPAQGIVLAQEGRYKGLVLAYKTIPDILARYFGIDQDALEREKQAMREEMREMQEERT